MELILFITLTGLAGLFTLAAGISKDRTNLVPGGLIFLFVGLFLIIGQGLQIQDGVNYSYEDVNGSMEVTEERNIYQEVESPSENADINEILGLGLLLIGVYFLGIAGANTRFFTLLRR